MLMKRGNGGQRKGQNSTGIRHRVCVTHNISDLELSLKPDHLGRVNSITNVQMELY